MEFGIFSQMHVPPGEDEHSRFLREVDVAIAVDDAGFKYDWAPEHHFLEHDWHQPAPEVFLSFVAARALRLHVGHAIVNITAPVNHPARVAERIATLDHLSEGRVEFGPGRGSSSAEWGGFAIPSADSTRDLWRESIEQSPPKWRDEPWWTSSATFRLLLSEYAKFVAVELRVKLADLGLDLTPEWTDQPPGSPPHRPATAQVN